MLFGLVVSFEKSCQNATVQSQITSYSIALNYQPNNGVMHHIRLERWNYLKKIFLIWSQSSKIPNKITRNIFDLYFRNIICNVPKKKYNWIPRTREKIKINHSGFHGDAAHLDILNLISVGAQNGSCAFRVLVRTLTFSFWNQFLIGSEIINVIIGLDNCQINARTWAHVIDNTSCNGVTNLKMNKNNNL